MRVPVIFFCLMLLVSTANSAEPAIKLHRHTATHTAWNTNAYFVESDSGIILIDAQLLASDAKTLAAMIKSTGKPLAGAIITHPHLDHYGGLPVLRETFGNFPIYAASDTTKKMAPTHKQMLGFFKMPNAFGEALDERLVEATNIVRNGETLTLAGVDFLVHELGAADASSNLLIYQKDLDVVFAGDSFYPYQHYYLGEGHIDGAREHLQFLLTNYNGKTMILGGHANAASAAQASDQLAYIDFIVNHTQNAMTKPENLNEKGQLNQDVRAEIVAKIAAKYPFYESFGFDPTQILTGTVFAVEAFLNRNK